MAKHVGLVESESIRDACSSSDLEKFRARKPAACTVKRRVLQGMCAQWGRAHTCDNQVVIERSCLDKLVIDENLLSTRAQS